jgi:dipeptidyl aminopeptidase/acylaminoacyl peptidase
MRRTLPPLVVAAVISATLGLAAAPAPPAAPPPSTPYRGHGEASVPPEVVARYAPKPLPPALSARIQSLLDVRAPGTGRFDPVKKRLYFTWTVTGIDQVWRLDGPNTFPLQMTGGEDRTAVAAITPDGATLVVSRDRRGEENPGLYLQSSDGGPLRQVQHLPDVQTFAQWVSDDGRWLYFKANDRRPDAYALYRYDLRSGERQTLVDEPGLWDLDDVAADGKLLLRLDQGSMDSEYWEWDPATRRMRPLLGQGEEEKYAARYAAQPGELLVLTPKLGEFERLYRWRPGGELQPVTPELRWDVEGFSIDRARRRVTYQVNEGGFSRAHALDAATYRPLEVPAFPEADHVRFGPASYDGRYVTVAVETSQAPQASFVLDWETGALERWVVPSAPEVDTSRFAVATLEHYPARDGTSIPMLVRRPSAPCAGPCPVIVDFHGGPESQARPGFSTAAQLYVDSGFVYVQPNVRGSEGYGKTWLDADNGPKRLDIITDIEDAARFIKAEWAVDGQAPKVGILGGSYGGYSVLVGMTMFGGAYDAGVSRVGISDLRTFLLNTAPYRRILRVTEYGDPEKDAAALDKLSPTSYLDRVKGPLLIIQGVSDPRVPAGESIQIHERLSARGVPSELILLAGEGHGAQRREGRVVQNGHTLRFFLEHLKGERPGP